jgi:hypothetical protein
MATVTDEFGDTHPLMPGITPEQWAANDAAIRLTETAWGDPMPDTCAGDPTIHQGYSDFDGECRDCGYGTGIPTCDSCQ